MLPTDLIPIAARSRVKIRPAIDPARFTPQQAANTSLAAISTNFRLPFNRKYGRPFQSGTPAPKFQATAHHPTARFTPQQEANTSCAAISTGFFLRFGPKYRKPSRSGTPVPKFQATAHHPTARFTPQQEANAPAASHSSQSLSRPAPKYHTQNQIEIAPVPEQRFTR